MAIFLRRGSPSPMSNSRSSVSPMAISATRRCWERDDLETESSPSVISRAIVDAQRLVDAS